LSRGPLDGPGARRTPLNSRRGGHPTPGTKARRATGYGLALAGATGADCNPEKKLVAVGLGPAAPIQEILFGCAHRWGKPRGVGLLRPARAPPPPSFDEGVRRRAKSIFGPLGCSLWATGLSRSGGDRGGARLRAGARRWGWGRWQSVERAGDAGIRETFAGSQGREKYHPFPRLKFLGAWRRGPRTFVLLGPAHRPSSGGNVVGTGMVAGFFLVFKKGGGGGGGKVRRFFFFVTRPRFVSVGSGHGAETKRCLGGGGGRHEAEPLAPFSRPGADRGGHPPVFPGLGPSGRQQRIPFPPRPHVTGFGGPRPQTLGELFRGPGGGGGRRFTPPP